MKKITLLAAFLFSVVAFSQSNRQKIQAYFDGNYSKLGITKQDASDWNIISEAPGAGTGITSVYVAQQVNGTPIFNAESNVWMKNNEVLNVANNFQKNVSSKTNATVPTLSVIQGMTAAYTKLGLVQRPVFSIVETKSTKSFMLSDGVNEDLISAKLVYQTMPDASLKLAWSYQFYTVDGKSLWDLRIDALNGNLLEKNNLMLSCNFGPKGHTNHNHSSKKLDFNKLLFGNTFSSPVQANGGSYRVIPFNYISPNHSPFQLIASPENALASPNGWHDVNTTIGGTTTAFQFTYTRGNNVLAQEDADGNNGNGLRADGGATLNFDFPYVNGVSQTAQPTAYTDASLTNLFYMNNIMHDVWYQYGFDEASGNFQAKNLGRGGVADTATGDYVFADGQDGYNQTTPTLNNANFSTPNDGIRPRMQMFMWNDGAPPVPYFTVNSPSAVAGIVPSRDNTFDTTDHIPVPTAPITSDLVLYTNVPVHAGQNSNSACAPATNAFDISGKIAVLRRGGCFFSVKVKAAQDAGALAVIVIDSIPQSDYAAQGFALPLVIGMTSTGVLGITIPAIAITKDSGDILVAEMANGPVNATIQDPGNAYLYADGSFDNGIIGHEYGHGISNKLIGGRTNSSCMSNLEQMGEGWSDWFSLMMGIKTGDVGTNPIPVGTYAVNQPNNGGGIRSLPYDDGYPYSTDLATNPLTLINSNNPDNSNTGYRYTIGKVWASIMWDLTWAYIDKYGLDSNIYTGTGGNNKVMKLALDALKLEACNTDSFIITRDALFAADQATTGGQDYCMIAEVFRRRGVGLNASSGSIANSADQVEDFTAFPPGANCTLAVNYFDAKDMIKVYPNPSTGVYNVRIANFTGKITMQVVDINGRVVYNQTDENFNIEKTINLSAFQSGIYILKVSGNDLNFTEKLVKN